MHGREGRANATLGPGDAGARLARSGTACPATKPWPSSGVSARIGRI